MKATAQLIEQLGGKVAKMIFLVELPDLKGREVLKEYEIESVVKFSGE